MKQKIIDNNIIKNQLLPNKVNKESILKLFKQVNRNMFVDEDDRNIANIDENFYFNNKRFLLKSSTIGKLLNLIVGNNFSNVLNVGSTTGYSSVLLSKISNFVLSLESEISLHEKEKKILKFLEIENIRSINGDLHKGCRDYMPYDLIFVNGCLKRTPSILLDQLNNKGYLVCIELNKYNLKKIVKYKKNKNTIEKKEYYIVNAPILM